MAKGYKNCSAAERTLKLKRRLANSASKIALIISDFNLCDFDMLYIILCMK